MRGKVTYRHAQPARHFVFDVAPLSPATLRALEEALGRPLTNVEQHAAARAVESARFWIDRHRAKVSAADCRATLRALVGESDALSALERCDPTTRALVLESACIRGRGICDLSEAAGIRSAARDALEHFPEVGGSQPTPLHMLAAHTAELWRVLGGPGGFTVNAGSGFASKGVKFAVALFEAAGAPRSGSAIASLLRGSRGK